MFKKTYRGKTTITKHSLPEAPNKLRINNKKSRCLNRKEGNDQEPIQLPNTFRPETKRERRTHLKQRHHNQNTTSRKPKQQFLSQKLAERLSKIIKKITRAYMQRHTTAEIVNHSRSTALERSEKILLVA